MKPVLFIFAKAPLMGKAKTRLAAGIGVVHAQRIYRAMCAKIFRECVDPRWDTILYVTPDNKVGASYGGLWPSHLQHIAQGGGGLTERLAHIFNIKGPVIAIGTDTPSIKKRDIANGFKSLQSSDAVFGPAEDGGFWLIGLNGPAKTGLFENIRWSHSKTLADMEANLDGHITRLHMRMDIDDVQAYRKSKQG
ncbi:MAG: hypothetical protein COA43_09580 [Robiginitomaculum sp.]|nr:MAG: hypothetical protein COA43_09580 [Robiginitomaculum sp.]